MTRNQIVVELHLPALDSKMAGLTLQEVVESLADANMVWFTRLNTQNLKCASCAGFTYKSPPMDTKQVYLSAQDMLASRTRGWSCVELVAYDVGLLGANGYDADILTIEQAPFDFHFVYSFAGNTFDPSRDIQEGSCVCAA